MIVGKSARKKCRRLDKPVSEYRSRIAHTVRTLRDHLWYIRCLFTPIFDKRLFIICLSKINLRSITEAAIKSTPPRPQTRTRVRSSRRARKRGPPAAEPAERRAAGDEKPRFGISRRCKGGGHDIKTAEKETGEIDAQPTPHRREHRPRKKIRRPAAPRQTPCRRPVRRRPAKAPHRKTGEGGSYARRPRRGCGSERLHPLSDADEDGKFHEREIRHDTIGGDAGVAGHREDHQIKGRERGGGKTLRHHRREPQRIIFATAQRAAAARGGSEGAPPQDKMQREQRGADHRSDRSGEGRAKAPSRRER